MTIKLVCSGQSDWHISLASTASAPVQFAADELQRYIGRISGTRLPIREAAKNRPGILVGLRDELPEAARRILPKPAEGYDGYTLLIDGGVPQIIIAGDNERGVIYGAYDLLERMGCRWFYPDQDPRDCEVVPSKGTIELEPATKVVASPTRVRICNASSFFFDVDERVMKAQLDVAMKQRYNAMGWQCDHRSYVGDQYEELVEKGIIGEIKRRGMMFHGPAHCFPHFLPTEVYFEKHPEWFGMRDGKRVPQVYGGAQFCWSNAEARAEFVRNAEKFALQARDLDVFCLLGFDGGPACACPECSKHQPADLIFRLLNELIETLEKTRPGLLVETSGAYAPVDDPPEHTSTDRLRVVWAHWGRSHHAGSAYNCPTYSRLENLETWRKAAKGGFTVCQYYTDNFASPWISAPYPTIMQNDREWIVGKKIDGIYMLVYPKGYWWNHHFNQYMGGLAFYDASVNPWDLIGDWCLNYFGADAGPLLTRYYLEWAQNIDLPYRVKENSTAAERKLIQEQRRLYIDPAVAAVKGDDLLSYRVGKVETLHRTAEVLTEAHRLHDQIKHLRSQGDFAAAADLLEKARSYTDEVIQHMFRVAELDQGLIEKKEVPGFITLGIKGWLKSEEQAIAQRDTSVSGTLAPEMDSMSVLPADVTG